MPTITDELGGDSLYGLAMAVYTLANMVALVAAGEMADRRGPAVPYVLSIATFIGGLAGGRRCAPTMVWVVVGRILQGAGTGGLQPLAYTLVNRAFPTALATEDVRDPVRRLGAAQPVRPGDRRLGRRHVRLAVGVPRHHPVRHRRRPRSPSGRCGSSARPPTISSAVGCRTRSPRRPASARWPPGCRSRNPLLAVAHLGRRGRGGVGGRCACCCRPASSPLARAWPPSSPVRDPRHRHVHGCRQLHPARRRPHPRRTPASCRASSSSAPRSRGRSANGPGPAGHPPHPAPAVRNGFIVLGARASLLVVPVLWPRLAAVGHVPGMEPSAATAWACSSTPPP